MTNDNFNEAARAEAERRYSRVVRRNKTADEWLDEGRASGFASGAEWARTHLAAQEPTDAEVEAAARELASAAALIVAAGPKPWEWWTDRNQARFRNAARAALPAARAARRDEEAR